MRAIISKHMKRYRIINLDFDSGPSLLSMEIQDHWENSVKESHQKGKEEIRQRLLAQFGWVNGEEKINNYMQLGNKPFSIIAFHNKFMEQIRNSFIACSYYPALTGSCALGERILNHLLLNLRDDYKATPEYKDVYRKKSFDKWDVPIDTLESWGILLPNVAINYRALKEIRNKSIHFDPSTDQNDRPLALDAITTLTKIIEEQFSAGFGKQSWFIPSIAGASFLTKNSEKAPFIKKVYIPNCVLVGPYHELQMIPRDSFVQVVVKDDYKYEDKEISDEEFANLYNNKGTRDTS